MFGHKRIAQEQSAFLAALDRSLAVIEFAPDGTILTANENFCSAVGYELSEIKGQHHSMFVEPTQVGSPEYVAFWAKLGRGEFDAKEYKRLGKGGADIWIQASYNPVLDAKGVVRKVVKVATVVTAEKRRTAEFEGTLEAISRVQGVIEFTPGGDIITANRIFLDLVGYGLDEIKGRHHRLFVDPSDAQSPQYQEFWKKLNDGEFVATSFRRIGKGGKEIWIQASYNPIFDLNRKVMKVVKFATDITDLTEIGNGLARLANNDFQQRIDRPFVAAFEKLRTDFNLAHDNLRATLARVADSTNIIQAGAQNMSAASDNLSRRTEQQAASLEQTAAALDGITATVRSAAEGASHARHVVMTADEDGKRSIVVVRQAVDAMDAISKSANQITQIIGVIDEIAFQTNLLALNAGVEAARAGDAGRGFAVVASEVRALAQRSAEAAKQIKSLISASSLQVDAGVKLVAETGKSLERILTQVTEINDIVGSIASGARDQSTGLGEVNTAIGQMDQVTQQNAAMVEESTAASHALSMEAAELSEVIGRFRIGTPNADDAMRRELQKAAPHAFRAAIQAPPVPVRRPHVVAIRPRALDDMPRPATARAGAASNAGGWDEF